MLSRLRATGYTLTPDQYRRVALVALAALAGIVMTGAAVRLTGSGLGCPDWPKCRGGVVAPLDTHAWIEYGNRLLSGFVGLVVLAAGVLAWRRRPFRRDLARLGLLLPAGVLAQGVLGGFTVRNHLAPGFVMAHFLLSMLILVAAVALAWRASHEPGERPPRADRRSVWAVRALLPLGSLVVFAGTVATAAGPHAGSAGTGEPVHRLDFKGAGTLDWTIHWHGRSGTTLGVATVLVFLYLRRRGAGRDVLCPLAALGSLIAAQGVVGLAQYELALPAELVWVHVTLSALIWVALLWAVAAAGTPAPRRVTEGEGLSLPPVERTTVAVGE